MENQNEIKISKSDFGINQKDFKLVNKKVSKEIKYSDNNTYSVTQELVDIYKRNLSEKTKGEKKEILGGDGYLKIIDEILREIQIYDQDELLDAHHLNAVIYSSYKDAVAFVFVKHIKRKLIVSRDELYIYDKKLNIYSKCENGFTENVKNKVIGLCKSLVTDSIAEIERLVGYIPPNIEEHMRFLQGTPFYSDIIQKIYDGLRNNEAKFDEYNNQIHFKNGYIKLNEKTLKVYPRVFGVDYVTKYIDRNFVPASESAKTWVDNQLNTVYTNKKCKMASLFYLLRSFTGTVTDDQYLVFMKGMGSSGKSTLINFIKIATECYFTELNNDLLTEGNSNVNKILNLFEFNKMLRFCWINELKDKKVDAALLKKIVDGDLQTIKLYKEGSFSFKLYALICITANKALKFDVDTGITRRVVGILHDSKFVDTKKEITDAKTFLKDKKLLTQLMSNDDYKNAFIEIIVEQCAKHNSGETVKMPAEFLELKEDMINDNDKFKDFIDIALEDTGRDEDRISKRQMQDKYLEIFKRNHASVVDINSALREKGLRYQRQYRVKGQKDQGCYVGYKFKDSLYCDKSEDSNLPIDQQIINLQNEIYGKQQLMLKLQQQLPITKDDFEVVKKPVIKVQKHPLDTKLDILLSEHECNIDEHNRIINKSCQKFLELLDDWKVIEPDLLSEREINDFTEKVHVWVKSNKKQKYVPKLIAPSVVYKHDNETYELDKNCKDDDLELSDAENLFKI
jgi:hypothetical protein